jgi:hypothetical protein
MAYYNDFSRNGEHKICTRPTKEQAFPGAGKQKSSEYVCQIADSAENGDFHPWISTVRRSI